MLSTIALLAGCVDPSGPTGPFLGTVTATPTFSQATVSVQLQRSAPLAAACVRRDDPTNVHLLEADGTTDPVEFRFSGLLPSTDYDCTIASTGPTAPSATVAFRTEDPPGELVTANVVTDSSLTPTDGYTVLTVRPECAGVKRDFAVVLDPEGNNRWTYELPDGVNIGVEVASDGPNRFLWGGGDDVVGAPAVVDVVDGEQWKLAFPGSEGVVFHHDVHRIADGRVLSLELNSDSGWEAFQLRLSDDTGATSWLWDVRSAVATGWLPAGGPDNEDPHHLNWADVVDTPAGLVAYASLCYSQLVVAVDVATGEPLWRFGAGGDFSLVDPQGEPLPDSEYPQCQHGLQMDGTHLLVYDNGAQRGFTRSVEYTIDAEHLVATKTWEWRDEGYYEPYHGGMDWLSPDHGRVLVAEPSNDCAETGRHAQVAEVDRPSGDTVVQRMTLRSGWLYRAHRVDGCDVFEDAKYCAPLAARLDQLRPVLGL